MNRVFKVVFTNLVVLLVLVIIATIPLYFYGANRLNTFFEFTKEHTNYLQPDSTAMFIHKPNAEVHLIWPEHPEGEIYLRTNDMGFREKENFLSGEEVDVRILVTGDSHTDGVVYNDESFPNILEHRLNGSADSLRVDVINGGTGFYSFRNYFGFIEKYKALKPDYFIINIFMGNDFRETLLYEPWSDGYFNVLKNAYLRGKRKVFLETASIPLNQGLDQLYYFNTFPEDKSRALDIAKEYMQKTDSVCASEGIELIVTLLPAKSDLNEGFRNMVQNEFGWQNADFSANDELKRLFLDFLNGEGIRTYDLEVLMGESTAKLYWDQDLHINDYSHKLIGEFLAGELVQEIRNQ